MFRGKGRVKMCGKLANNHLQIHTITFVPAPVLYTVSWNIELLFLFELSSKKNKVFNLLWTKNVNFDAQIDIFLTFYVNQLFSADAGNCRNYNFGFVLTMEIWKKLGYYSTIEKHLKSRFFKSRELYWSNLPQNSNLGRESLNFEGD